MKILLITNSARGEAIADALHRSPQRPEITAASTVRSPGLLRMCTVVETVDMLDFHTITELARKHAPDFAFIAPDDPIGAGLADALESIGIPCVAPRKSLARIEASKGFARSLMEKYGITGNPFYQRFGRESTTEEIRTVLEQKLHGDYVVKYDALRGGKGVKLSGEHLARIEDGIAYAEECIAECGSVVIEEKLVGVEFSLLSFVSGTMTVDMPAVQDHKRAYEGDTGPNTGGMGTYSDSDHSLPFLSPEDLERASAFNKEVAQALSKECNAPYRGILYGGFIATAEGVKVIEYNARFGDPEALNILPLLTTDFVTICQGIIEGSLSPDMVRFEHKATVCKYITPMSYPDGKNERHEIVRIPSDVPENIRIFYGDVSQDDDGTVRLGGSRSIGIVGIGATLREAESIAEEMCCRIEGPVRHRSDIGTDALIEERKTMMKKLREGSAKH